MGVIGLWSVLSEICERKPLTYLSGKKVAIDLSGWVVQATTCKGLNTSKKPHLRNLFFRVSRLLQLGVYPIFVIEGEVPSVKEPAFKERNFKHCPASSSATGVSRTLFDKTLKECQDILTCLGIPCIKSSGEAEAFCAFLCLKEVVDGVITEDSDAFLYGADVVYRDFTIEATDSHINMYCLKSERNKLGLNRQNLVALALLLGCDYSKGVPGIGKETALKLLSELNCDDILQRFKDWKTLNESELFPGLDSKNVKKTSHCNRCGHLGSMIKHKKNGCSACGSQFTCYLPEATKPCRCPWHINNELMTKWKTELKIYNIIKSCPDFPDLKVIEEYLNFTDNVPSHQVLTWKCPNLVNFQEEALNSLGWTFENSYKKVLPLITSWQQFNLQDGNINKTNFLFEPVKIIKERNIREIKYFDVEWKLIDENDTISSDNIVTQEYYDRFSECYKDIVEEFYSLKSECNEKKKLKNRVKKLKSDEGNRKVKTEYPLRNHDVLSSNTICSPKYSPFCDDSFNGLLDLPLWERVKAMPNALLQKFSTPVSKAAIRETSVFFDKSSGTCSIFSPLVSGCSDFSLQIKYAENLGKGLTVSVSPEKLNFCSENITNHLLSDVKPTVCFDFSDDSFLDKLLSQKDKSKCFNNSWRQSVLLDKVLTNICSSPVELLVNSPNLETCTENMEYEESFSSPSSKVSESSACLLYSVNRPPKVIQDRICLVPLFSDIFNDSTPTVKGEILSKDSLSTPVSSKVTPKLIFSPLIFDSSIDDVSLS